MEDRRSPAPPPPPTAAKTPGTPPGTTSAEDAEHLRLLSIFHYVVGALAALFALLPTVHLVMGIWMAGGGPDGGPPAGSDELALMRMLGGFMSVFAGGLIGLGLAFAGCLIAAGRFLAARTHYTFCMVVAGVACTFVPFGTVLGVFTLLVLMRPGVKALFSEPAAR